jgi:hypothetical protein
MNEFAVLSNRKRALIALVHSLVFLLLAMRALVVATPTASLWRHGGSAGLATFLIYLVVTTVLLLLFRISAGMKERLYFGFCASSAALGLLRTVVGDPPFHAGQYLRVLMLAGAVLTGMAIVRTHAEPLAD